MTLPPTDGGVNKGAGGLGQILIDELKSPLNVLLITACLYLAYKLWSRSRQLYSGPNAATPSGGAHITLPPPLPRQDMTLEQLAKYDGTAADGRILVAVNHRVFDVTRGSRFYGPGGPYAAFAGKDASRGLATFSVEGVGDHYDDLSDLTLMQMESVKEWDAQFTDRYIYVGKLLKPGETPAEYTEEEEEEEEQTGGESEVQQAPSTEDKKNE